MALGWTASGMAKKESLEFKTRNLPNDSRTIAMRSGVQFR